MAFAYAAPALLTLTLQAAAPTAPPVGNLAPAETSAAYIRAEDYRIARIGYRLGLAGVRYCPETYPLTGLGLHHLHDYGAADRAQAIKTYRLSHGPAILSVVEDSPAAGAGLKAGDVLLAVNGQRLVLPAAMPGELEGNAARLAIEATERRFEDGLRQGPAELTLLRDGQEMTMALKSVPGCPARVRLARSSQMNAFANRGYAIITSKLLDFTRSDDEVAIILGHEIAHNILHHPDSLEAQGVPRGIFRSIGKNAARVRATEEEADRLGLKLAWAAGYDVSAAIPYWRRYYAYLGPSLPIFRTHPSLKAREKIVNETLAELRASAPRPTSSHQGTKPPQLGEGPLRDR